MPWTMARSRPIFGMLHDADRRRRPAAGPRGGSSWWSWRWRPRRRGGLLLGQLLGELGLELALLPGLVDPGAPELVGDEQQDQDPDGDEAASDPADDPSHRRIVGGAEAAESAHVRRPRTGRFDRRPGGSVHSSALVAPHPGPRRLACRSSSDSAPPCASSDASRPSPVSISTSTPARSCCSPGRTARARPRCCASSPVWCRCTRARPRSSAPISPSTGAAPGASSPSSATRRSATTT